MSETRLDDVLELARLMRAATYAATPGRWGIGAGYGSIIAEHPVGRPGTGRMAEDRDVDYYGGYLVCESVGKPGDMLHMSLSQPLNVRAVCERIERAAQKLLEYRRHLKEHRESFDKLREHAEQAVDFVNAGDMHPFAELHKAAVDAIERVDWLLGELEREVEMPKGSSVPWGVHG